MRPVLLAIALLALSAPALAQTQDDAPPPRNPAVDAKLTPAFQTCLDSPGGESTYGMIQCITAETDLQDKALNAEYRRTMADLNPRQKAKFQAAERAWMAFRDAECRSFQDEDWGSLSRINAHMCLLDLTVERLIALEAYPPE